MNLAILNGDDSAFAEAWSRLGGRQIARSALYNRSNLVFYRELRQLEQIADLTFVVASGNRGILGMMAQAFQRSDGTVDVSCHGLPCLYGQAADATPSEKIAAGRLFKTELVERLTSIDLAGEMLFRDYLDEGAVSQMAQIMLRQGAVGRPFLSQTIDLSQSEAELRAPLGKTIKWSLNWGLKNLVLSVRDAMSVEEADMEAFRQLHISAAGRETRSIATWSRQLDMVKAGEAFIVLGDLEGELVTAALFITLAEHCFYGVSASKRELFDKPLGHAVVWTAMMHARGTLGIRWFELGEQAYSGLQSVEVSDKEKGISFFKRSFGGSAEASLELRLPLSGSGLHTGD